MYANATTVREARAQYFAANGFDETSYREKWAKLKLGWFPVVLPNTKSRQAALPLHDLHHVATGYDTTVTGEGEIAAFEIGGGCGRYVAAWVINAGGFALGLLRAPRRTYRAFIRGRHARTLYRDGWRDELLELSVGELRNRVGTAQFAQATSRDVMAFALWCAAIASPWLVLVLALLS
jgi:hypothetical protein